MAHFNFDAKKHNKDGSEWHTYGEWKALGWCVLKGERSVRRDEDGVCLFHNGQVGLMSGSEYSDEYDEIDLLCEIEMCNLPFLHWKN